MHGVSNMDNVSASANITESIRDVWTATRYLARPYMIVKIIVNKFVNMKTVDQFVEEIKKMEYTQTLDKKYEGACPCFTVSKNIEGYRVYIHGHCWRSGANWGDTSQSGCGLHAKSKMPKCRLKYIVRTLKKQLDKQDWYGEWHIVYENK